MDRAQFMRELENLLADIQETERREALEFYDNYFDDAGPENEASVIQELGSPQKVAAIIKADLKGSTERYEYGEYTEHGYEDPRMKEVGQMPEKYGADRKRNSFFRKGNQAVLILAVIALVFISPFIKGMLGLALKIVLTIVLLPFVLVAVLGLGSLGLWILCFSTGSRNYGNGNWMPVDRAGTADGSCNDEDCNSFGAEVVSKDH